MTVNTARKTAAPAPGKPFKKGDDPRRGVGKKGRSGRKPDEFKAFLAELKNKPALRKAIEKAASDADGRNFSSAWKTITDYDDTKPAARSDVTSKGEKISGVVVLPATGDE